MLFQTWQYFIFLIVVLVLYYSSPSKLKNVILLLASYYFYASWNIYYLSIIIFTTVTTFFGAIALHNRKNKSFWLFSILFINLMILIYFKYFNLLLDIINHISGSSFHVLDILLPVGISFYTLQSIGYLIDVYRGDILPEYNFIDYATFVSFFPQLVAGPIERSYQLLPQIKEKPTMTNESFQEGVMLIIIGLYKKLVLATSLKYFVDIAYANQHIYSVTVFLATALFGLQIYFDFSAYTDIARGTAKLFGISLMENFNSPYTAKNIQEFWRRWHISLSTWFKDYVYLPLGGSKNGFLRMLFALFVVFTISGLWHGASYNFLVWGLFHWFGICALLIYNIIIKRYDILYKINIHPIISFGKRCLFILFIIVSWLFFRSHSWDYTTKVLLSWVHWPHWSVSNDLKAVLRFLPFVMLIYIVFTLVKKERWLEFYSRRHILLKIGILTMGSIVFSYLVIYIEIFFSAVGQDFIYFQF